MSTQYRFIDPARKERVESFQRFLKNEIEQAVTHIKDCAEEYVGLLDQMADPAIDILRRVPFQVDFSYYDFETVIGTCSGQKFSWMVENGFYSAADVMRYSEEHPRMVIEDEYGTTLTLLEFVSAVKSLTNRSVNNS